MPQNLESIQHNHIPCILSVFFLFFFLFFNFAFSSGAPKQIVNPFRARALLFKKRGFVLIFFSPLSSQSVRATTNHHHHQTIIIIKEHTHTHKTISLYSSSPLIINIIIVFENFADYQIHIFKKKREKNTIGLKENSWPGISTMKEDGR